MKTDFGLLGRQSRVAFSPVTSSVPRPQTSSSRAFTRTELLATLVALFLLGAVALPLLAGSKPRSERVLCLNNLRQIGVALNLWATDHGNLYPWRVQPPEGVRGAAQTGNPWYSFAWVSNELATPKVLMCPADKTKRMASSWGFEAEDGFLNASNRNNALSYAVGLDAFGDNPNHVLSGDRNLNSGGLLSGCSALSGGSVPAFRTSPPDAFVGWTDRLHYSSGNTLFTDGRAVELSSQGFREAISGGDDNGAVHILLPQ
jgi:hypothetical protein